MPESGALVNDWSWPGSRRHRRLFLVVKVDEKDVPPRTVLRDLEEIYSSLESTLSGQRSSNVRQRDWAYRSNDDMAVTHAIATSHSYVTALPNSYRALDCASADCLAKLFGEDHAASVLEECSLLGSF
jgi:hypothetical protein